MDEKNNQAQKTGLQIPERQANPYTNAQQQAAINYRRARVEQIYGQSAEFQKVRPSAEESSPAVASSQPAQTSSLAQNLAQKINSSQSKNQKEQSAPVLAAQSSKKVIQPISKNENQNSKAKKAGAVDYAPNRQQNAQLRAQQIQNSANSASAEQWKRYHAAWQNYYQKYYENYYNAALNQQKKNIAVANIQPEVLEELTEEQKRNRALAQLKRDIAQKAREQSQKIRKNRHFVPIISAVVVVGLFLFLQYNRLIFASVEAYVSPGNATAEQTIQTPNSTVAVGDESRLIIPKINVDVPVVYGVGADQASQLAAMEKGVAHFSIAGANSVPGQLGNTVLSGHSSNDLFDGGDYKFIFAQLEKLEEGDIFYANYKGVRYSYVVRSKEVVLPTEVSKVVKGNDKAWMTLITCTPLGTAQKRLLVFAEQVSPDVSNAKAAEDSSSEAQNSATTFAGNSKTFFERLFTWDWS